MTIHVVRLDDVKPQPWRNGGGVTRELLAWPDASDWSLRLSVADIERDGPFSAFPGIDRWFAVLTGYGVRLGAPGRTLVPGDAPVHFDGAVAPDCLLIDGPTRDLNLMIRREFASGWMKRVDSSIHWPLHSPDARGTDVAGGIRGVFAMQGCTMQYGGNGATAIPAMAVAWTAAVNNGEPWFIANDDADHAIFAFQCSQLIERGGHHA